MRNIFIIMVSLGFLTCSSDAKSWNKGSWKAKWTTPATSYPEMEGMKFAMTGLFKFEDDSLTIIANGYPGCIFYADTLEHTQLWKVIRSKSGQDSVLQLQSNVNSIGISYVIKSVSKDHVQLQLLTDIFIDLTK